VTEELHENPEFPKELPYRRVSTAASSRS